MERIGPTALKILALLLATRHRQQRPCILELVRRIGVSRHAIQQHLGNLRNAGLVTWEHRQARTLRPTVEFIPL